MKIFLLNTNNFGGLCDTKPMRKNFSSREEYNAMCRIFQNDSLRITAEEAIISAIETENPDVIVFQEFDVNAPAGRNFIKWSSDHEYQPIYPDKESEAKIFNNASITMMFVKKQLQIVSCSSPKIKAWRWCISKIDTLKFVGVHAPLENEFLAEMEKYAINHRDENLVMLGDFNITTNKERTGEALYRQKRLETMRSESGYIDAISEPYYKDGKLTYPVKDAPATFFCAGTTVDQVLVSKTLKKNFDVKVTVFSQKELALSDHAVIIVEIDPKEGLS